MNPILPPPMDEPMLVDEAPTPSPFDFTDAQHKKQDEEVTLAASEYLVGNELSNPLEYAFLLQCILMCSDGKLQVDALKAKKLLQENGKLVSALEKAWKTKDYKEIRELDLLTVPKPDKDEPAEQKKESDEHRSIQTQVNTEPPQTPRPAASIEVVPKDSPPRLKTDETLKAMEDAIRPFRNYIHDLAQGRFDAYLDSIRPEDKPEGWGFIRDPILLLHDLGNYPDHQRINKLFIHGTVHLFAVSGSGKTRLSLEGLCQNWGIYISCRSDRSASGSRDFAAATQLLGNMSTWNRTDNANNFLQNAAAAERVFAMLLCARLFILHQYLQEVPVNTDPTVARRRWVLAQVLPPTNAADIFVTMVAALRHGDTHIMRKLTCNILCKFSRSNPGLFSTKERFFVVIDESQVAANQFTCNFRSSEGNKPCPILREMYQYFDSLKIFAGIILSGTGLSMSMVNEAVKSVSAKMGNVQHVITDVKCFTTDDPGPQMAYFNRYLTFSDSPSDLRLLQRMRYWLFGRYRFTASVIELLLYEENVPRHRVLTQFIAHTTGFTPTDATDLEEGEAPISQALFGKIASYGQITSAERLFHQNDGHALFGKIASDGAITSAELQNNGHVGLIRQLLNIVMRWTVGSEPTFCIKNNMHTIIASGIGFLDEQTRTQVFNPSVSYPVYISEPLAILSLMSLFQKYVHTSRNSWFADAFCTARNPSSLGFVFEEVVLCVLVEAFGGQATELAKIFHCHPSLASRKVSLVSLMSTQDGNLQTFPVSWASGTSDRLGFKAKSPTDLLDFLRNPRGKAFVFPDIHMGPDLLCFLQDQVTMELIVVAIQVKVTQDLDTSTWLSALSSVNPKFFYTIVSRKGGRQQYAPVSYPGLYDDVLFAIENLLGPAVDVHAPEAHNYRTKLRSTTQSLQYQTACKRKTPRFLRVIATPDDEQSRRLRVEWKGDVAILLWDNVREYLGPPPDVISVQ